MASEQETYASGLWKGSTAEFRRDRLIVSVRAGAALGPALDDVRALLSPEVEALSVHNPPRRQWAIIRFNSLADAETRIPRLAEQLASRPELRYAEPDFICRGHTITNDPMYGQQWWPQKINIEDLWRVTRGSGRVLLAILDSGIAMQAGGPPNHQDLSGARYIVGNALGGFLVPHDYTAAITMMSWPFIAPHPPRDLAAHGTHVTGIAAALSNNGHGVAGANWVSDVYVARVLDQNINGSASSIKLAVNDILRFVNKSWLTVSPVFPWHYKRLVINLSLGFLVPAESLVEVCEETSGGKVIICASAASRGVGDDLQYPGAFASHFPHVFAVGSTNQNDVIDMPKLNDYSGVTIFAPGVAIPSTTPAYPCTDTTVTPLYGTMTGTSQASPIVAGVVTLLWSARRSLTPDQIRSGLLACAAPCHDDQGKPYPRINLKQRSHKRWLLRPPLPWE